MPIGKQQVWDYLKGLYRAGASGAAGLPVDTLAGYTAPITPMSANLSDIDMMAYDPSGGVAQAQAQADSMIGNVPGGSSWWSGKLQRAGVVPQSTGSRAELLGELSSAVLNPRAFRPQKMEMGGGSGFKRSSLPRERWAEAEQLVHDIPLSAATVRDPQRIAYNVYTDLPGMVRSVQVAPESPALKRLFGRTRAELADMANREGTQYTAPFKMAANPKGSPASKNVMTDRNADRLLSVMEETRDTRPDLYEGMKGWYVMDPIYERQKQLVGPSEAKRIYNQFNTMTAMASPASNVIDEIRRGTAANWLHTQGRFDDFFNWAGKRGIAGQPGDMSAIPGHFAHVTAHGRPMQTFVNTGQVDMGSAKVPTYIASSSVPDLGFNTNWAVGDAHNARALGLADTRKWEFDRKTGKLMVPGDYASAPEMTDVGPWFQEKVAAPMGLEAVPTQAITWGAFAPRTGVKTAVGQPKLELLADQIMNTAERLKISPEEARDMVLLGRAHAG